MFDLGLIRPERLPCRVLAVGNITVGGTGKTTTVRWLTRRLQEWGLQPAVLSYGYRAGGGKAPDGDGIIVAGPEGIREPVSVSGDEPQILARSLPGVPLLIGRRRKLTGRRACAEFHPDVCVLDDAFQYWRLEKDVELVLLNGTNPFGYDHLLPRGMLREPLSGLRRAHGAIITHAAWMTAEERGALEKRLARLHPTLVVAEARHVPVRLRDHATGAVLPLETVRGGRWVALSALGQPESFERTLAELGADSVQPARFPDHHAYHAGDLERVAAAAHEADGVVTTEKDAVKIPSEWLTGTRCLVLEIDLQFLRGQAELEQLLRERIQDRKRNG
jgi:tetraacyldisaccharide 4'-kinase